jgi:hypothetical protein
MLCEGIGAEQLRARDEQWVENTRMRFLHGEQGEIVKTREMSKGIRIRLKLIKWQVLFNLYEEKPLRVLVCE